MASILLPVQKSSKVPTVLKQLNNFNLDEYDIQFATTYDFVMRYLYQIVPPQFLFESSIPILSIIKDSSFDFL